MNIVIVCPTCGADIHAHRVALVRVTCPACGDRHEINMEREQ